MKEVIYMFAFFNLIFMAIFWGGYEIEKKSKPQTPPIKDINKFCKETVGMPADEIKKGLRNGRW